MDKNLKVAFIRMCLIFEGGYKDMMNHIYTRTIYLVRDYVF